MRKTILSVFVAMTVMATLAADTRAAINPTPRQAARAAKACFVKHHWWTRFADGGTTVNARAPRKLRGYPYRPWYSVAYNEGPHYEGMRGKTYWSKIGIKLNTRERRVAAYCTRAAWR